MTPKPTCRQLLDKAFKLLEGTSPDPNDFDREWNHFSRRPGRPLTDGDKELAKRFWTLGQLSTDSSYAAESREYFRDFPPEQMKR